MGQLLTMWCGLGGIYYYPRQDQSGEIEQSTFELYPAHHSNRNENYWDPFSDLVEKAHVRGIQVWGYTSPQYQGSLQANPHSPIGEKLPFLYLSDFANRSPEYWGRTGDGSDSLEREGYVILSLSHHAVRQHLCDVLSRLVKEKGLDGLELEWITGSESSNPYAEPASALPYNCTEVDPVGQFIKMLTLDIPTRADLSIAASDDPEKARNWGYDWPGWCEKNLVDAVVLRHNTQDLAGLAEKIRQAKTLCGKNVRLISQLNCWSKTGYRDAASLTQAARTALQAGADQVGIYRADAVQAYNLWPAIKEISDGD